MHRLLLDLPPVDGLERLLCHLVEAREAAIRAGLPAITEAIERAIVAAAPESRPRGPTRRFTVIDGLKAS